MRVLFTTWAWPSHYFPQVPLAWALRSAGHEVRMTSQPELLTTMLNSGLPEFGRWWRPDLVVYDPITYAGPLVARLLGVPAVRHLFGPDVTYFGAGSEVACLRPLLDRLGLPDVDLLGAATIDPCPPSLQ